MTVFDEDQLAVGQGVTQNGNDEEFGNTEGMLSDDSATITPKDNNLPQTNLSATEMLALMEESEITAMAAVDNQPMAVPGETLLSNSVDQLLRNRDDSGASTSGLVDRQRIAALLVPLTGSGSEWGRSMLNAAQLAMFSSFDENTLLFVKDTLGTPEGAAHATSEAINEGASILVGPLFSESVRAAAPIARRHGVTMVGLSNDRTLAGEGVYVFGFTPHQQVKRIVFYAASSGLTRMAALVPYNDYGYAVASAFNEGLKEAGIGPGHIEYFQLDASDAADVVQRIAMINQNSKNAFKPALEGILIAAGGKTLRLLATRFPYFDIETDNIRLLGTELWQHENLLGEPSLNGGWFVAPATGTLDAFNTMYKEKFESEPLRGAVLAYDAVSLAGTLMKEKEIDFAPPMGGHPLRRKGGFIGIQGAFRFNAKGVAQRALAIYQVSEDTVEVIDRPIVGTDENGM